MSYLRFLPGQTYHVYNRGNNHENIFMEDSNYHYFLYLYNKYISPIADTYAFNLLPNHYHFSLRIKDAPDLIGQKPPHQCFSNMMNAYTKAYNKWAGRRGSLFEKHLKRKLVENDEYFRTVILYIHRNPQAHGWVEDFMDWPYSSFPFILENDSTFLQTGSVLEAFNGPEGFLAAHRTPLPVFP